MNILITGGAGYIGTELISTLDKMNNVNQIVVYDNLSRKNYNLFISEKFDFPEKIIFVNGDILDSRTLQKTVSQYKIDTVFHLAAKVSTPYASEDPHVFEQVNHWGTAELSYVLEQSNVKRVFYLSTTSVYESMGELVYEDTLPNPKTNYGISKFKGEKALQRLESNMDVVIIRSGNVFGYSKSIRFDAVINKFMLGAHYNNQISIEGDGNQVRAFIHVNKLVSALGKLLTKKISSGTYNLFDKNLSVNEIANTLQMIYPEMEILYLHQGHKLRSLQLDENLKLAAHKLFTTEPFLNELTEFKSKFAF